MPQQPTAIDKSLELDEPAIYRAAIERFRLRQDGIHGPIHWARVYVNGMNIAKDWNESHPEDLIDLTTVKLFALLHDCRREDECTDSDHGQRAAEFADGLLGTRPKASKLLFVAIRGHSNGQVSGNATIQACWDADRLDLPRVGIWPHRKFMGVASGSAISQGTESAIAGTIHSDILSRWQGK